MSQFPDEAHLSSWAGICPGNNESAGVNKSGKIRKGNKYLKATLCEAAWSASKKKVLHTALTTTISPNEGARREP
jgi:transposase